jgi:hypothetical protein
LDAADDDHGVFDTAVREPWKGVECEDEAKHIFE